MVNKRQLMFGIAIGVMLMSFVVAPVVQAALPSIVPVECRGEAPVTGSGACDLGAVEKAAVNVGTFILGISGSLALVMFVWGGFMYIFAGGNQAYVKKAKSTISYAVIGLIVVMAAGLIIRSVVAALTVG